MKNSFIIYTLLLSGLLLNGCAFLKKSSSRQISSTNELSNTALPRADWHFFSTSLATSLVYTPFFTDGRKIVLYSGGYGAAPKNGVLRLTGNMSAHPTLTETTVIQTGPDAKNYNYFRSPRVAKSGSELWMLVEVSGCYAGCDSASYPKSLAVYQSTNDGITWNFLDYVKLNGKRYVAKWMAQTGLIYNPQGSKTLNLKDLTQNRFITIGEDRDMMVSADGINYHSIPINHPFPKDRLVFASIAKTPYGFHLTSSANWSDSYYTTTIRHLFSKDLIHWYPLESNSFLKHPQFYKGVHLSYDEKSNKLWAISSCGSASPCGFIAWLEPKDYLVAPPESPDRGLLPVGEFVHYKGHTAMIIDSSKRGVETTYKIRYANGTYDSGYTKDMFTFPLASYNRQGCVEDQGRKVCVGDPFYYANTYGSIMGFQAQNPNQIKYAIKYSNGVVDTGFPYSLLSFP